MKNKLVVIPSIANPIQPSPGFAKKWLSEYKLDLLGLCGYGCVYCSSNAGNYLRINREEFADLTEAQLGTRIYPADDPSLTFIWHDVLDKLKAQLDGKHRTWGKGKTLVFSMLTDGFSPLLLKNGVTEEALRLVLEKSSFRIRVLTKNAIVGSNRWLSFFKNHPDRFVVGLSTGTLNDDWARRVEIGTSSPSARLRALSRLQSQGIPTYGMLCPVFPDVLAAGRLEELVERINPAVVEHVWIEPYNDRGNWRVVRDSYPVGSFGYRWLTEVFENHNWPAWSQYATELYIAIRDKADREGWLHKLRYLLYEDHIVEDDARKFRDLEGVLLQSKPNEDGLSCNIAIAALQHEYQQNLQVIQQLAEIEPLIRTKR